jgi:hypothetical protein
MSDQLMLGSCRRIAARATGQTNRVDEAANREDAAGLLALGQKRLHASLVGMFKLHPKYRARIRVAGPGAGANFNRVCRAQLVNCRGDKRAIVRRREDRDQNAGNQEDDKQPASANVSHRWCQHKLYRRESDGARVRRSVPVPKHDPKHSARGPAFARTMER